TGSPHRAGQRSTSSRRSRTTVTRARGPPSSPARPRGSRAAPTPCTPVATTTSSSGRCSGSGRGRRPPGGSCTTAGGCAPSRPGPERRLSHGSTVRAGGGDMAKDDTTATQSREDDEQGHPLDAFAGSERPRRRWGRVLGGVAAVLVVVAAGYVGASWARADTVPRGVTVAGVDIGGRASDVAVATLTEELRTVTVEPI